MSGHSKWSTIKHKKAVVDAKRGKVFTKIARTISIAARDGNSGDPSMNPTLRVAMDKAREANMPKDNVARAIERGMGKGGAGTVEEITYEGYGPSGVGVIVRVLTDNRNRSSSEIKNIFDRAGGSLGAPGSVMYLKTIQPTPMIELDGGAKAQVVKMLDDLDDNDDAVEVWSNLAGMDE